jgi:hypothetical protein
VDSSKHEIREPDSNVTVEREPQPKKHRSARRSIEEGTQIDESDEQYPIANFPRHASRVSDSNSTLERELHREKHSSESFLTMDGIQIDKNDEQYANAAVLIQES